MPTTRPAAGVAFVLTAEPDAIATYRPFLEAFAQAQVDMPPPG